MSIQSMGAWDVSVFEGELRGADDVCWNCFSIIRESREEPSDEYLLSREYWYGGFRPHREKVHTPFGDRPTNNTEMGYPPQNTPARPGTMFCECGMEGAFARYRHPWVGPNEFDELLTTALKTLLAKGIEIDASAAYYHALEAARKGFTWPSLSSDEAIAAGILHGISTPDYDDDGK